MTLLDGVTGAGKTEVYFEAIGNALSAAKQVLVLVPEIALGTQWLSRFTARFDAAPEQWHSDLTRAHRRRVWRAVAIGTAKVVVGARSALFLPFASLGLIVVDEEHDGSFQTGRRRQIPRPRHGRGACPPGRHTYRPCLSHPFPGNRRQC